MTKHKVNLALQILPQSESTHPYTLVDKAIEVIKASGLPYQVCPFETVIEGTWDEVMNVVKEVHEVCYANDAFKMLTYIKIQSNRDEDVRISDKMKKYS